MLSWRASEAAADGRWTWIAHSSNDWSGLRVMKDIVVGIGGRSRSVKACEVWCARGSACFEVASSELRDTICILHLNQIPPLHLHCQHDSCAQTTSRLGIHRSSISQYWYRKRHQYSKSIDAMQPSLSTDRVWPSLDANHLCSRRIGHLYEYLISSILSTFAFLLLCASA